MKLPSRWIGRWIMIVAVIHTLFGVVTFTGEIGEIVTRGVWNSVGADPLIGAVSWFLLFGAIMFVLGAVIDMVERGRVAAFPNVIGIGLLATTITGIVLMPESGFWLLLPPACALLLGKRTDDLTHGELA